MAGSIKVNWGVSVSSGNERVSFEDLGINNRAEWDALSESEKHDKLQEYLDELPERTSIVLEDYEVD